MAEKWLVERLTKSKQGSAQWVELAEALEEFWDTYFFANLQTLEDGKNIFTANDSHLNKKIAEFGDYFDTALPIDVSSKRLSISWQRANIHEKNTIVPFINSLQVNFAGLNVTWEPLYSNRSFSYAKDNLFTEQEINLNSWNLNDFWMTSRGKITVDLAYLHRLGMTKSEFITIAKREIDRLRPSHIVYDGEYFILTINFTYEALSHYLVKQVIGHSNSMFFRLTASFDERQADIPWLDESPLYVEHLKGVITQRTDYELGMSWSLDLFVDIGSRRIPLSGREGDKINPVQVISHSVRQTPLALEETRFTGAFLSAVRYPYLTFNMHDRFDDVPADSISTNAPLHGLSCTTLKSSGANYQLGADWSLDLIFDIGNHCISLSGKEGDKISPIQATSHSVRQTPLVLEEMHFTGATLSAVRYPYLTFNMHSRFDDVPADNIVTDASLHGLSCTTLKSSGANYQLGADWSLDLIFDIGNHCISLSGKEGDKISPIQATSHSVRQTPLALEEIRFTGATLSAVRYLYLTFNMHSRFDDVPADSIVTDTSLHGLSRTTLKSSGANYQLGTNWSLDLALITSIGSVSISGIDGADIPPIKQNSAKLHQFQTHLALHSSAQNKEAHTRYPLIYKIAYDCMKRDVSPSPFELSQSTQINFNPWLGFDEIPTDFVPLDTPLWS
ncbi:hypothetical protein PXH59_00245 (plasmid) [Xenorhabdus sp. SF857]|uniref:hypothetical protein n=1 Tax=Xenorhabdus bakwenae TaxID=3026967 RepID=UPI002557F591|nr:hypothetical protein [Xenorhabdus sp. SF857]WFQ78112.1 hypothetical protein PXH59_00245 [Xenorhabdus sp. SF857]